MDNISEQDVRRLRDLVFGHTVPDKSWELIKTNWMQPEEVLWLQKEAKRINIPIINEFVLPPMSEIKKANAPKDDGMDSVIERI